MCHLSWGWKTPSKACQYLVLDRHHNLPCSLTYTTSFLLHFLFIEALDAHMKAEQAVHWPLRPVRLKRSEKAGIEACT